MYEDFLPQNRIDSSAQPILKRLSIEKSNYERTTFELTDRSLKNDVAVLRQLRSLPGGAGVYLQDPRRPMSNASFGTRTVRL